MIPLTLFEKFSSLTFITSIKVFYVTAHSGKSFKLRKIHSINFLFYCYFERTQNSDINQGPLLCYKFAKNNDFQSQSCSCHCNVYTNSLF